MKRPPSGSCARQPDYARRRPAAALLNLLTVGPVSGIKTDVFEALRQLIYDHSGIYFEDNKRYLLESRVNQRMRALGCRSDEEYLDRVRREGTMGELTVLVNAVTINETFFNRHPMQLEVMVKHLLPELIRKRSQTGAPNIRIWSAACSSGDEAYSIAIMIREKIQPLYPKATFEIVGTDIDSDILASAERAVYAPYAVRTLPEATLKAYFKLQNERYVLNDSIRRMVTFKKLNLADPLAMRSMQNFDIIVCANVLIYFDAEAKRRTLDLLHQGLRPDGYLFIGFSETLYGVTDRFNPVRYERSMVYRRTDATANGHAPHPALTPLVNVQKSA